MRTILLMSVTLLLGILLGWYWGSSQTFRFSNADIKPFKKSKMLENSFTAYGEFRISGNIIRIDNDETISHTMLLIVPAETYLPGNYEVMQDGSGRHLVHIRNRFIPSSSVTLESRYLEGDIMGKQIHINGHYGEMPIYNGSTTSLNEIGLFVVRPSELSVEMPNKHMHRTPLRGAQ